MIVKTFCYSVSLLANTPRWFLCALLLAAECSSATADDESDDNRPPVTTGAGGSIELEKAYQTARESQYKWHSHLLWESRYVSEGRDNLSGDGLFSLSSEFIIDDVTFVPWLAHSPNADFSELNLSLIYGTHLTRNLAASIAYTHLHYRAQDIDATDNEISLNLAYPLLPSMSLQAVIYYSFYADGAFSEIACSYEGEVANYLHFNLSAILGANAGYVIDGHDGLNHFQLQAGAAYIPLTRLELYAYTGYTMAIDRNVEQYADDEPLGDFFWGGVGLHYLF